MAPNTALMAEYNLTIQVLNFCRGNKNMYLNFMSFLDIDMTQVV